MLMEAGRTSVRVQVKGRGYYEVLTLDNVWDKAYKRECSTYEELPEEIQRKLAVLTMVERNNTIQGVGRKMSPSVYWIHIDKV